MRILMLTVPFAPSRGGVQTVVELLSRALAAKSHDVCVATEQAGNEKDVFPFQVLRRPSVWTLFTACWRADRILVHGPSLRLGWPLLVLPRKAWMVHHIWPATHEGWMRRIVRKLLRRRCHHLAVSDALARAIGPPVAKIPNPFDASLFKLRPDLTRDRDLIFIGRLIREKGADVLMAALAQLASKGLRPSTTLVGDGPELNNLREQVKQAGLDAQVTFAGEKSPAELAPLLNQHRIMVVPSTWDEPFGIVALEGMASGCSVVASNAGGLPEALGSCGHLFERSNVTALAETLSTLLCGVATAPGSEAARELHLAQHTPAAVADRYLVLLGK